MGAKSFIILLSALIIKVHKRYIAFLIMVIILCYARLLSPQAGQLFHYTVFDMSTEDKMMQIRYIKQPIFQRTIFSIAVGRPELSFHSACRMLLADSSPDKSLAHLRENEIMAKCMKKGQSEMSKCLYSSLQCGAVVKDCIVHHREQRGVVNTALKRNTA